MKHNKIVIENKIGSSLNPQFFENLIILHLKHVNDWIHTNKSERNAIYILNTKNAFINLLNRYGDNLNQSIRMATKYTKVKHYKNDYLIYFYTNGFDVVLEISSPFLDIIKNKKKLIFIDSRRRFEDIGLDQIFTLETNRQYQILEFLVDFELQRRQKGSIWQ